MSRRPLSSARRILGNGSFGGTLKLKQRLSRFILLVLFSLGPLIIAYLYWGSEQRKNKLGQPSFVLPTDLGNFVGVSTGSNNELKELDAGSNQESIVLDAAKKKEISGLDASSNFEISERDDGSKQESSGVNGGYACSSEAKRAIPTLKKAYDGRMQRVLHVGPDSCSVVSELLKEEDTEAWGMEAFDIEDAAHNCQNLVRRGIVRTGDIKTPLPYREDSFSLVIVSDAVDYLSTRYLNNTLPDLARLSSDGLVIFAGNPEYSPARRAELSKFGRPARMRKLSWWRKYFAQINLEEDEDAISKFEEAARENQCIPSCLVFHIKPLC